MKDPGFAQTRGFSYAFLDGLMLIGLCFSCAAPLSSGLPDSTVPLMKERAG
jgi:hypothetical protein